MANNVEMLDKLQNAVLEDGNKKKSKPQYHFDKLRMYFGEDFNYKGIKISMPTIGDILEIGEENFFRALSPFTHNSTSIRVMLWENNIDWNKVSDIETFNIMSNLIKDKEPQKLLFKNFSSKISRKSSYSTQSSIFRQIYFSCTYSNNLLYSSLIK